MPLLGAHQSIAGGLHLAFDRNDKVGGECLQIFTANQRQWRAPTLQDLTIALFREQWLRHQPMPVASHASYLINLAALPGEKTQRSLTAFIEELERCKKLGIRFVVIHPGRHGGAGIEQGLAAVVSNLDCVLERSGVLDTDLRVLLETTAGQGTSLGSTFAELGWLLQQSHYPEHLGICVDTCHIFAAGYDLTTQAAYEQTFYQLERDIGCRHIHWFHCNDSKKSCGSKVDRHEHIGQGAIGLTGFGLLLNDPRFANHPMTLETPKSDDLREDRHNLQQLRSLLGESPQ